MKDGFIIHRKTIEQIKAMTDEQAGELLRAMIAYNDGEVLEDVAQLTKILMVDVSERMDADAAAYERRVKSSKKAASARWNDADGMRKDAGALRMDADGKRTVCEDNAKNAVSDSVSDSVSVKEKKIRRFTKPTVEEVRAYIAERGSAIDAQTFVDFYESKGWRVGNQPMKDWQAAVRNWERRERDHKPKAPPGKQGLPEGRRYDYAELERRIQGVKA